MVGLIIAVSVMGLALVSAVVYGAIKLSKMEKDMTTIAECLVLYMDYTEGTDIVENDTDIVGDGSFDFPNSDGF